MTNYAIVGAGILGASVARALLMHERDSTVTILEKEFAPAQHQTGHNSGVVHPGLYYQPGSLKARMCRRGVELIREYTAADPTVDSPDVLISGGGTYLARKNVNGIIYEVAYRLNVKLESLK